MNNKGTIKKPEKRESLTKFKPEDSPGSDSEVSDASRASETSTSPVLERLAQEVRRNTFKAQSEKISEQALFRIIVISLLVVILIVALMYGIYLLLGDCFTSMILAFITSLYLRRKADSILTVIRLGVSNR